MAPEIFDFGKEKNQLLKRVRGVCFDDVIRVLSKDKRNLLDDIEHPNRDKYPHQRIMIINIKGYAHLVPYIITESGGIFLKTVFPNKEMTRKYLH